MYYLKMIVLSIDSSSNYLSIGLSCDGIVNQNIIKEERASKIMLVEIDNILKKYNIQKESINYIVFNKGPGSFTGTRVASSVIQAIAFVNNIPVIGRSSMWLMAYQASKLKSFNKCCCIKHAYGEMIYVCYLSLPLNKNEVSVSLIKKDEFIIKDCKTIVLEDNDLSAIINSRDVDIVNLSKDKKNLDAKVLIDSLDDEDYKIKNFDFKQTFPDYANHKISN